MIIKRINDNTISCTITAEDLRANGFELDDFFDRKKEAVEFIRQTVAQIANSENFDLQGELTTMRVSVLPDHSLNLLITRETSSEGVAREVRRIARSIFDSVASKAAEKASQKEPDKEDNSSENLMKSLLSDISDHSGKAADGKEADWKGPAAADAFMFSFFSVRDAMNCCRVFAGAGPVESSLYYLREDDTYFLIIRRTENTPDGFEKCVLSANEFGELVTSEKQYIAFVTEHGMCIAREHAIEMFLNVIPGLKMPAAPKAGRSQKKREEGKGRQNDSVNSSVNSGSSEEA